MGKINQENQESVIIRKVSEIILGTEKVLGDGNLSRMDKIRIINRAQNFLIEDIAKDKMKGE